MKLAYSGGGGGPMIPFCPPSRAAKEWRTIDCHLHLLDFLQKSSGTQAAKHAMDGALQDYANGPVQPPLGRIVSYWFVKGLLHSLNWRRVTYGSVHG